MERPDNISQHDWFLLTSKYKNMTKIMKKIDEGYPLQYLIGHVDFYGLKIEVNKHVLIPRYETEYLIAKTKEYIDKYFKNKSLTIVDAGTGSGCIALKMKSLYPHHHVYAFDKSSKALQSAQKNAQTNNLDVSFQKSTFKKYSQDNIDILISNPPYIAQDEEIALNVKKYEPAISLWAGEDGLKYYLELINNKHVKLNKPGLICFEIGYEQGILVSDIIKSRYKEAYITIEKDLTGKDRYIFAYLE